MRAWPTMSMRRERVALLYSTQACQLQSCCLYSGIMLHSCSVAAKSHDAASAVAKTFRERDARKLYCALCFGHPSFDVARWEDRIMVSKRRFKQRISSAP